MRGNKTINRLNLWAGEAGGLLEVGEKPVELIMVAVEVSSPLDKEMLTAPACLLPSMNVHHNNSCHYHSM